MNYDQAISLLGAALAHVTDEKNKFIMRNDLAYNLINYANRLSHLDSVRRDFKKAESIIKEELEIFIQNKEDLARYLRDLDVYESHLREPVIIFFINYTLDLFRKSSDLFEQGNIEESLAAYKFSLNKFQEALDVIVEGQSLNIEIQKSIIRLFAVCFYNLKHLNDLEDIVELCDQVLTKPLDDEYKKELKDKVAAGIYSCMLVLLHNESLNEDASCISFISFEGLKDSDLKMWEEVVVEPELWSLKAKVVSTIKAYNIATISIKKDIADNLLNVLWYLP